MPKQQVRTRPESTRYIRTIKKVTKDHRGLITICKLIGTRQSIEFFQEEFPRGPKLEQFLNVVNSKHPRYRVGKNNDHIIPIFSLELGKHPDGSPSLYAKAEFQ